MNRTIRFIRHDRIAALACAVLLSMWVVAAPISLAASPCLRPDDQLWIVSTRHLGCPDNQPPELRMRRLHPESGWHDTDVPEFVDQTSDGRLNVIYVHGNRMESDEVTLNMWDMYRCLTMDQADVPPIRFVMWSWPSDRRAGILRDVRAKALRTESEGYYLGWFLAQLPDDRPVRLVGYSFGARIVNGANHLLGGGELAGRTLAGPVLSDPTRPLHERPRVVLMAAATHGHWLRPGCYHHEALRSIASLLNIYNSCDRTLKRYGAIDRCSKAEALGYAGMFTGDLGTDAERIQQINAAGIVGRQHAIANYQRNRWLRARIQAFLFTPDPPHSPTGSR
jgi:hypothetical protein